MSAHPDTTDASIPSRHDSNRPPHPGPVELPLDSEGYIDVTVIVPVQSPEAEVRDVAKALGEELDRQGRSWEIIFVFDGVEGRAWQVVQELREERGSQIKTILFKSAFGESVCLTAGYERASGRYILTSPQYVQIDPLELGPMLAALDGSDDAPAVDFVIPWRSPRVDPVLNRAQSVFFNWVIRQIIRGQFHDLNCYFRAMKREVLDDISIYGDMYRFLPVMAFRQGFTVEEIKVRHLKEWGKAGFFGLGVYLRRFLDIMGVMFLTKFTLKPLRFFGTLGGIFSGIGSAICTYMAVEKYIYTEPVGDRPLLTLGVLLIVLGVQIIGFGLVGEIIIYSQAKNLKEYRIERIYE
ncbi:Undecaprenyl-phosphate 4-deoxy-4-formamido-L-arabinose transferase [Planctomycetes bacterium Pla163]|uniref:Undecaprenyl-phosphate 4-deoxy-4-formamido-L-arabinose transferase n=1 Tax=Rohdeia mirabilis TaxID=2528008 RepID=A0A518D0C0_9BACT|nr:Undecaprenyl-phosphate 4-deoxy-4-formamido-L-arabinose transferase [Planctomycetes bacterium Pla163]